MIKILKIINYLKKMILLKKCKKFIINSLIKTLLISSKYNRIQINI